MSVLFYDGVDHMIEKITTLIKGKANNSHTHGNGDITSLDAGKITSGTISIDRLPQGALERLTIVADDTARFKLTSSNVQKGDTVKVVSTGKMYYIVDETKLSSEDGYEVYAAGTAASVPWSGVTGKPNTYTPSSHTHTKSEVGLENVDNTSDANKSVKYATSAGSANAVAWSDVNGKPAMPESGDYSSDNIEALLKKIMGLTPRMGSTCFTKDTHIENAWWNFFYIPHRDGVGGDNGDYGTLLLFPMAWDGLSYIVRAGKGGVVASISSIITSSNISSQSVDSATTVNGHTVESNVPANAKFTDTDTWRPQPDWNATSGDAVIKNKPASLPANGGDADHATRLVCEEKRPTSANKASSSDRAGMMEMFLASSSMTTGKPSADAKILQMNWDNTTGWDSQLAMINSGTLQHRNMSSGKWQDWKTVLDSSNYKKQIGFETGTWNPILFDTASHELIAQGVTIGNYYRLGDIVFIEAMILTTSSYACHHISGLPYEPDHSRPSNVYPIGIVSSGNGTNSPFNLISGSGSYYVQNGAYASGKTYSDWYVYGWYRKA